MQPFLQSARASALAKGAAAASVAAGKPKQRQNASLANTKLAHTAEPFNPRLSVITQAVAYAPCEEVVTPRTTTSEVDTVSVSDRKLTDAAFLFRFVISNSFAGVMLGPLNATILTIKRQYGVHVQFTRPGTAVPSEKDRMMVLAGESIKDCSAALAMIIDSLASLPAEEGLEKMRLHNGRHLIRLVIPSQCVGKVLGPKGEQIKAISEATGAIVVVAARQANAAFHPFRMVSCLANDVEHMLQAAVQVMNSAAEDPRYASAIREISSVCFEIVEVPGRRIGLLMGPGGASIRVLQDLLSVKIGVADAANPSAPTRFVSIWGSPLNVSVAKDAVLVATGAMTARSPSNLALEEAAC